MYVEKGLIYKILRYIKFVIFFGLKMSPNHIFCEYKYSAWAWLILSIIAAGDGLGEQPVESLQPSSRCRSWRLLISRSQVVFHDFYNIFEILITFVRFHFHMHLMFRFLFYFSAKLWKFTRKLIIYFSYILCNTFWWFIYNCQMSKGGIIL